MGGLLALQNSFAESLVWRSLSGNFWNRDLITAAHIFPSALGQTTMTAIFQTENEHFSSRNSLLMRSGLGIPIR